MNRLTIGVLALQGAFAEHERVLGRLGALTIEVREPKDLDRHLDGLVLPGGESTVQAKLLHDLGMFERIRTLIGNGLPTFGTCAGLLLLARHVTGGEPQLALMDVTAARNAYGRQINSFATTAEFDDAGRIPMTFIRAPYITEVGSDAHTLATVDGRVVAARQHAMLVTAFHPELTADTTVHQYFLDMVRR